MGSDDHLICREVTGSLNSVAGITTSNEIEDRSSISFEGEIFRPHTGWPCNLRSLLYHKYNFSLPGLRQPRAWPSQPTLI
jgi:hypothetical protein